MAEIGNLNLPTLLAPGTGDFRTFNVQNGQQFKIPAAWMAKVGEYRLGYEHLTLLLKRNDAGTVTRFHWKLVSPVVTMAAAAPGTQPRPEVLHTAIATVEMVLPDTMTRLQRERILATVAHGLLTQVIADAVLELQPAF